MKKYSPSSRGFYDTQLHGEPFIDVPDPQFIAPVDDPEAQAPLVRVKNLACSIPADAVDVSDSVYADLLAGQAAGKAVVPGTGGAPTLADPAFSDGQLADAARRQRDALLSATDWSQGRDISDATALLWQPYRQALRDVTSQPGFPRTVIWPVAPQ